MANISTATVRVYITHKDNATWNAIDFDNPKYAGLRDAICEMSYDCKGFYDNGSFSVNGRWSYTNNFNWIKERTIIWEEFLKVRNDEKEILCFSWVDFEPGCDWIGHGDTYLDGDDHWEDNSDTFSFAEAAKALKVKKPRANSTDGDAWDQFYMNVSEAMAKELSPMEVK